jgi:hypothetical protein
VLAQTVRLFGPLLARDEIISATSETAH